MSNHAFPFRSPSTLPGLVQSASLAAALASAAVAQVLEYPTPDESQQVVQVVAEAIAAFSPNPVCVSMVSYDATFVQGPVMLLLANNSSSTCIYLPISSYILPFVGTYAQSISPPIRAGLFVVIYDWTLGSAVVLPYGPLMPACCLVPYGTHANDGILAATGSTSLGSTVSLSMANAQSPTAAGIGFAALRPYVLPLLEGTALIDLNTLVGTFAIGTPGNPTLPITVPSLPSLVGLDVYFQGVFVDSAAPVQLRLTNGVILTIT